MSAYYLYIMSQMQFCFVNWARSGTLFLRNQIQSSLSCRWLKCWEVQLPLCLAMAASLQDHSRIFATRETGLESSVHGDAPCSSLWELSVPWGSAHFPRTPHLFTGPLLVGAGQVPTCGELSHTCLLHRLRGAHSLSSVGPCVTLVDNRNSFAQFWRLEVQDKCAKQLGSPEVSPVGLPTPFILQVQPWMLVLLAHSYNLISS